jgi:dimethylhistidine N-methyltransferase
LSISTASAIDAEAQWRLDFARDVREGMSHADQKELPAKYLYDDLGSALFEAITHLPEYGVTRADERAIRRLAPEIRSHLPTHCIVAELGSGGGKKTRLILEEFTGHGKPVYLPIDVSAGALVNCQRVLEETARVIPIHHTYLVGLEEATAYRPEDHSLLLLFLGSNIGNFDRFGGEEFLREVRRRLTPGDALLIGTDLEKSQETLLAAYDDAAGVTAAFNRNVLGRINRELDADFDLRRFRHEARYNSKFRRVEMHLRSVGEQSVHVGADGFKCTLSDGETIWTEASHKYVAEELPEIAERTGFRQETSWVDEEWPFAESLWIAG